MEIDTWIGPMKVRAFPWIDGKHTYINVQYFRPGQSVMQAPAWDKSALLVNGLRSEKLIGELLDSVVNYIARLDIPEGGKAILDAE